MALKIKRTVFGDPILRRVCRRISPEEVLSEEIQDLIRQMKGAMVTKKFGVGLAAPQVGHDIAVAIIDIKPTPNRPDNVPFQKTIINPEVIEEYGKKAGMWEGCLSWGSGPNNPYAQVMRYSKVLVRYLDENAVEHEEVLDGLVAHVFQHETDHLHGILFVDRVKDPKTYTTIGQYRKNKKSGIVT